MAFAAACLSHATARNLLAGMDPSWWDAKQPEHSEGSIWKAFVPIAMWKKNITQQPTQGSVSICFYPQLKLAKRCLRLQTHRSRGLVYGPHNVLELGICRAGQISDFVKCQSLAMPRSTVSGSSQWFLCQVRIDSCGPCFIKQQPKWGFHPAHGIFRFWLREKWAKVLVKYHLKYQDVSKYINLWYLWSWFSMQSSSK